jgi:Trk K+ transport system NAD-binding subunit
VDPSLLLNPATRRAFARPFAWRGLAVVLVVVAGVTALTLGVGVTERDLSTQGLAGRLYYVLGLFVLGGLDLGTPVGGPPAARTLLWIAYFGAPLITASALLEAALRLVDPLGIRLKALNDHVVLGGAGRLTMVYVRKLREKDRKRTIVVVEQDANHPYIPDLRKAYQATVIIGNITHNEVLRDLRLRRAHRVLLLTGDDFANLDAAAKVLRLAPELGGGGVVAHMAQLRFMREALISGAVQEAEIFNGHEFAAEKLVEDHLLGRFRDTPESDVVVLLGFGRFGQTVLRKLQSHAIGNFDAVVAVDEEASSMARIFEEYPGFDRRYRHSIFDGNILDPQVWAGIDAEIEKSGSAPVFVVGSGNDGTNLQAALMARRRYPDAYVILRSFRLSPFTEEIARDAGIEAFHLGGLIAKGIPERWL